MTLNKKFSFSDQSGQSLIEIIVGLAIGGVLIGAAAFAISATLRSNISLQKAGASVVFTHDLLDKARAFASGNWQNIYTLTKGTSTSAQYFLNASGSTYIAVQGQEGMIDNDVTNGLVGEWKFDEATSTTSTVTYDTVGNNNGTLSGGTTRATSSASCEISNCLSFDGSSGYVDAGVNIPQTVQRTYVWWYKISANGSAVFPIPLSYGGYSDGIRVLWRDDTDDMVDVQITTGSDTVPTLILQSPTVDQVGVWYHYAVTYDGLTTGKLYRNGALVDTKTNGTGSIKATASHFYIGKGQYFWNGLIDDVRAYNRVLSATEVASLYKSNVYSRYFTVQNVCRMTSVPGTVTGVTDSNGSSATCTGGQGGSDDPSTEQVSAVVQWLLPNKSIQSTSLADFLTRAKNSVFDESDWSGGSGQDGPITQPNGRYASGTNVNTTSTPGSFQINNLAQ